MEGGPSLDYEVIAGNLVNWELSWRESYRWMSTDRRKESAPSVALVGGVPWIFYSPARFFQSRSRLIDATGIHWFQERASPGGNASNMKEY